MSGAAPAVAQQLYRAGWRLTEHDGLTVAGYMAFAAFTSLFPFLIFLAALASVLGTRETADETVEGMFLFLPPDVARTLAPAVHEVMAGHHGGLLTFGVLATLWTASSGVEALRDALNRAYEVKDWQPLWWRRLQSMVVVVLGALVLFVASLAVILGPVLWRLLEVFGRPSAEEELVWTIGRYALGATVLAGGLLALHRWLPNHRPADAGRAARGAAHARAVAGGGQPVLALPWHGRRLQRHLRQPRRGGDHAVLLLPHRRPVHPRRRVQCPSRPLGGVPMPGWSRRGQQELAGCAFADARLGRRLRKLIEKMDGAIGASLPLVCQDWANTKAAYRFFSNDRVSEAQILAGHFQATRDRFAATDGLILVVQDTTEFTFQRERPEAIGITCRVNSGKDKPAGIRMHTVCGLLMHASLAVTIEGLPLGLAAVKFWSRQSSRAPPPSSARSTRRGCRSSTRRASAGWRTCASPRRCSAHPRAASTSATARATSTSCSAAPGSSGPTSSSAAASTGWPVTAVTRSPARWTRCRSRACTRSRSATAKAASAARPSSSATGVSTCFPRSASRSAIPPSR